MALELFTSKMFVYPMKRNLLARKLDLFYRDSQPKREKTARNKKIGLQTDLEFRQNVVENLNRKHNIEIFSSRVCGGKV